MIHPLFSEKKDQRQPETRRDDPPTPCLCEEANEEVPGEPRPYHTYQTRSLFSGRMIQLQTQCENYASCLMDHTWLRK